VTGVNSDRVVADARFVLYRRESGFEGCGRIASYLRAFLVQKLTILVTG